jgi:peptidylprolyl isomerase
MKMHLLAAATVVALLTAPGHAVAQELTTDESRTSYALGYRAGADLAGVRNAGESLDMAAVVKGLQDAAAGKDPAVPAQAMGAALQALQGRVAAKYRADLERRVADNKAKGEAYLSQNRSKPGVITLDSGVQYREIESGSGASPTLAHQITVEFVNYLPDGTVLADTRLASDGVPAGPVTVRLSEIAFPGLREALQRMSPGDRWEVALPGSQAYGDDIDQVRELAGQALVFNIKLLSVGPRLAEGAAPEAQR